MEDYTQRASCIGIDSGDNLHVVWYGKAAATFNKIWYVKYDGSWGTPDSISTAAGMVDYDQGSPVIAIDSDLHVLWTGKATGHTDENKIWYAEYVASWATPEVLQPIGKSSYSNIRWSEPSLVNTGSTDLYGHAVIRQESSAELYGYAIIKNIGSVEAYGHVIIQNIGSAELYGHVIIRHSSSKDLYAKVNIVHWVDLAGIITIRHIATLNLPSIFWVRHPYRLWTNRRYLNGVIQLNETLLGNAILEYVIEGVMQDIKCQLINNDLDYSEWDDIVDTPKLIRRATTYGVVAALYARKARTFSSRVIPVMTPVTVTVMGDDERAMNHWVDKMNNALELYVSAQGGLLMDSSTADEEPVFSMDDIPPLLTDYTPWYEWLMKTRGSSS